MPPRRPPPSARPGTSSPTSRSAEIVLRFTPTVADRVREATWHPTQAVETDDRRLAALDGDRLGHHRDPPLDPVVGRRRRGPRARLVAGRRGRHAPAGGGALRGGSPDETAAPGSGSPGRRCWLDRGPGGLSATTDQRPRAPRSSTRSTRRASSAASSGCGRQPLWDLAGDRAATMAAAERPVPHRRGLARREPRGPRTSATTARARPSPTRLGGRTAAAARALVDAVAEQPAALGPAHERRVQLRRCRAGVSARQQPDVRVDRADRVEGSLRRAGDGHRRDPDGRRHPLDLDGVGPRPPDPHRGAARRRPSRCGATAARGRRSSPTRPDTTRLSRDKVHGHWYGLRVRATDRRGNVGPWSAERRVWVP